MEKSLKSVAQAVVKVLRSLVSLIFNIVKMIGSWLISQSFRPWIPESFKRRVMRPDDLLDLTFEFHNLRDAGNSYTRRHAGQPSWISVQFPPQHFAEKCFFKPPAAGFPGSPGDPADELTIQAKASAAPSYAAGPSYLVFVLPDHLSSVPKQIVNLLDWSDWKPVLETAAENQATLPAITGQRTGIEAPYRLTLTPLPEGRWKHALSAVAHAGQGNSQRTELWHTRLGKVVKTTSQQSWQEGSLVRAIRSPDHRPDQAVLLPAPDPLKPFRMSLSSSDRNQIVHLSAGWGLLRKDGNPYIPPAVAAHRLMLTSLGACLNLQGSWDFPEAQEPLGVDGKEFDLIGWQHRAALGRDQYVRVDYAGALFPLGHRAILVKITERQVEKVVRDGQAGPVAYLRQHLFLIIRQPERTYTQRMFPYQKVRILDKVTPDLDDPMIPNQPKPTSNFGVVEALGGDDPTDVFWPMINKKDFQFHLEAQDHDGAWSHFTAPLVFITDNILRSEVIHIFNQAGEGRRKLVLHGQRTAFAPVGANPENAAVLETLDFTWKAASSAQDPAPQNYCPLMEFARVGISPLKLLLGQGDGVRVRYYQPYLDGDTQGNQADVVLELLDSLQPTFSRRQSGGMLDPTLNVIGVSRKLGPVSGLPHSSPFDLLNGGTFSPADYLGETANLLGLPLKEVIGPLTSFIGQGLEGFLPHLSTIQDGDKLITTLHWQSKAGQIAAEYSPNNWVTFRADSDATFSMDTVMTRQAQGGGQATSLVEGVLSSFSIELAGVLVVKFKKLTFSSPAGNKPLVHVELDSIAPSGVLRFINDLMNYLQPAGFSDPPYVDVNDQGVRIGYSLAIPPLAMGIFSLQNVSLAAGMILPFIPDPLLVDFAFCARERPFTLSVSLFGGGGFFHLAASTKDIVLFEMALEFGGNFSLNLGVASGGVYCMAGIYFKLEAGQANLAGYVRLGGEVEVLCIASVSVEFYMELGYAGKVMYGRATMTVEVEVLFFSASVDLTVERSFAGGDPAFSDVMDQPAWDEYCAAFAAYPA